MNNVQLEANDVINNLLGQIAQLSQEKAMLQVQLAAALKERDKEGEEVIDVTT